MSLAIWTNHVFRPEVQRDLQQRLTAAGHRLLLSGQASPLVLAAGSADALLDEADVALGQPDVGQVMGNKRLKLIALTTAGYTRYDRADFRTAMQARGVPVTNASQVFADPCAQHVLAQMLAIERNLPVQLRNQDGARDWRYLEDRFTNGILSPQKTILLLGFGAIGRRLAELLQPFGCRVIAYRRHPTGDEKAIIVNDAQLADAFAHADHVVNILPDSPATTGWMNGARFSQMKPGARFYNIGRGTTVDQTALMAALASGHVGAAYLDVMDPEPLPPAHPLWQAKNCLITCHIGGGTREQDETIARHFLANLQAWAAGDALVDRIM
jgi:phosphoglycerate dehydrogenase-like enzyme